MGVITTTNESIDYKQDVIDTVLKLRIIDDTLFRIFANNKKAVNEIIDGYLGKHVVILDTNPQVTLTNAYREVILDSLSLLEDNTYVNIEMQNEKVHNDLNRCRFHASLLTANKTGKNYKFEDVPHVVVIYVMDYIGYDKDEPIWHNTIGDGYEVYLVTTKITDDSEVSELTQLLSDSSLEIHNDKYPEICDCFNRIKRDKEAIKAMCKVMEEFAQERAEKRAEFQKAMDTVNHIDNATKNGYTEQQACDIIGVSLEEYETAKKLVSEELVSA